jgi:glyoxylase-like metal-dependent hydrolase (beta-lactamase superfamily II)
LKRRDFLASAAAATCAAAGFATRVSEATEASELVLTPLSDQLTLISGGGGNVTVFNSPAGVLLVDGGSPGQSRRVLKAVRTLTGKRDIHTLFNSHWHYDQTGSNTELGPAGTRIIAHENTRLWLGTVIDSKWEHRTYAPLPPKARPNQTFYTTASLEFGGEKIDYGYLPQAHTDGDIYVYFRKADVLVGADVLAAGAWPILDYSTNGWIGGMVNGTQALLDMSGAATKYIAGKGGILTRDQVQEENTVLTTMKQRLSKLLAQGMSVPDMLAVAPASDFEAKWGDATQFITNTWHGISRRPGELGVNIV